MARPNKISYKEEERPGVNYQPVQNNYWQDYLQRQAAANAPAASASPQVLETGKDKANSVTAGPVGNAVRSNLRQQLMGGTELQNYLPSNRDVTDPENYQYKGQYGNTWKPTIYNQKELGDYDAGLQAARDWDAQSALSPGFKERVYKILNGERPEAQLQQFVPNAAMQRQTQDLGDGSKLMNPADEGMNHEWNVQRLREIHPDWDENTIQNYMNQRFNWQAYNALKNEGAIQPTEQAKQYMAYQQAQAEAARQAAMAEAAPSYGYAEAAPSPVDNSSYQIQYGNVGDMYNPSPVQSSTEPTQEAPQAAPSATQLSTYNNGYGLKDFTVGDLNNLMDKIDPFANILYGPFRNM